MQTKEQVGCTPLTDNVPTTTIQDMIGVPNTNHKPFVLSYHISRTIESVKLLHGYPTWKHTLLCNHYNFWTTIYSPVNAKIG